jgi:hypothetical protein
MTATTSPPLLQRPRCEAQALARLVAAGLRCKDRMHAGCVIDGEILLFEAPLRSERLTRNRAQPAVLPLRGDGAPMCGRALCMGRHLSPSDEAPPD